MYKKTKDVTLKTGESVELGKLMGPDQEWGPRIEHLLGHKGEPWNWQIHQCLSTPNLGVETYCHILSKAGRPIANISTFEAHGVGIFGHVFTVPEERKKGAADILNQAVMTDFEARGGRALYLGTTYDSPAYHIYRKHGFESVEPKSGYMVYAREGKPAFEKSFFAPGPTTIEPLAFKHWPVLSALTMMDHPARLRVLGMGIVSATSTESGSLELMKAAADHNKPVAARVAVSNKTQAPVVLACWKPEFYFSYRVDLMDVFFVPGFEDDAVKTIQALNLPTDRKIVCYADSAWPQKETVLQTAGFTREAVLRNHLKSGEAVLDVTVWSKTASPEKK